MSAFRLEAIRKQVGDFSLAVDDCTLEEGKVYAIVGPNGSGKSTLLNLLALLDEPASGRILFKGQPVNYGDSAELISARRAIGYVMQSPCLFHMKVYDNAAYGLQVRGVGKGVVQQKVREILSVLNLSHLTDRPVHTLSAGEAQRLALARTLVLETDVLLLDEPTANVDQSSLMTIEELISRLNREKKTTVILTTHSRDQACKLSKDIIPIVNGRISHIAYENVFSGMMGERSDGIWTLKLNGGVELQVAQGRAGQVSVAIDPEDIILSNEKIESSALNRFSGMITKVEDVDGSLRIFVDVGVVICALVTRKSYLEMRLNVGRRVCVTFKANAATVI